MFKKKNADESIHHEERVRIITEPFGGRGLGTGVRDKVWVVSAGVPMPQGLEQNSEAYTGEIPHDAIRFDEAGYAAYVRENTPRPEPPATAWWTEDDVKKNLGLSDRQFAAAKANGFPKPDGRRDFMNPDGTPAGYANLWTSSRATAWSEMVKLTASGR